MGYRRGCPHTLRGVEAEALLGPQLLSGPSPHQGREYICQVDQNLLTKVTVQESVALVRHGCGRLRSRAPETPSVASSLCSSYLATAPCSP